MTPVREQLSEEQFSLVHENIIYATKLARQFYRQRPYFGFDIEDYEGAAMLGLCDAARRYDPERARHFRTFCYFRIRGAMFDLLRHGGGISKRHFNRLVENQYLGDQDHANCSKPSTKETLDAEHLPFAFAKTVEELSSIISTIEQLNLQVHVNSDDEAPELSYARDFTPEELASLYATRKYLRKLIARLPEEEQQLIDLRYYRGCTFEEIGDELGGPSKSWISRVHNRAIDNLRGMIQREGRL